ncbi:hypothetical protein RB9877 [Rhodopirellula baltica SH 1]|uniref:Uncharacterized protein n=1 Tax=Rhodopirellula baltica (strain DSM 10527 / NCIMB 13988 / SH1) TaxID=243090 RepID=Q7UKX4_RHOBA|nr:hypothetical protein RB9877 [Rhodopirellula baltica SH 1]
MLTPLQPHCCPSQSRTVVLNCLRGWVASQKSGMRMKGTSASLLSAVEDQRDRLFESQDGLAGNAARRNN